MKSFNLTLFNQFMKLCDPKSIMYTCTENYFRLWGNPQLNFRALILILPSRQHLHSLKWQESDWFVADIQHEHKQHLLLFRHICWSCHTIRTVILLPAFVHIFRSSCVWKWRKRVWSLKPEKCSILCHKQHAKYSVYFNFHI